MVSVLARPPALDRWATSILRDLGIDHRYDLGFYLCENRLKQNGALCYANRYNASIGTIIAVSNYGKVNGYTAPDHWSDIDFLMWKRACGQEPVRIASLRFIIQKFIINFDTINLVNDLIPSDHHLLWSNYTYRAQTFTRNDVGFYALLLKPGIVAVHPCLNYSASLGSKKASKITSDYFSEINVYYMVIELSTQVGTGCANQF